MREQSGTRKKVKDLVSAQISFAEESRLLNQIRETNRSFTYDETLACMESFLAL